MPVRRLVLGLLTAAIVVAGCEAQAAETPTLSIDETAWQAVEVDGQATVLGHQPTVRFEGGRIMGSGGCNTFSGTFTFTGGTLQIGSLKATMRACDGPEGQAEVAFLRSLVSASSVTAVDEGRLIIDGSGGPILLAAESSGG